MNEQSQLTTPTCFVFAGIALLTMANAALAAAPASQCSADGVRDAREVFNLAIQEIDPDVIAEVLGPDVILLTGTDSDLFLGRDAQVALWQSDAQAPERLVYRRETSQVKVSPLFPIAMESGRWTGRAPSGDEVGGEYSAKWRCVAGRWMLEAEVFMTTNCSGALCL